MHEVRKQTTGYALTNISHTARHITLATLHTGAMPPCAMHRMMHGSSARRNENIRTCSLLRKPHKPSPGDKPKVPQQLQGRVTLVHLRKLQHSRVARWQQALMQLLQQAFSSVGVCYLWQTRAVDLSA